jgi:ATP-dependent Zn protease
MIRTLYHEAAHLVIAKHFNYRITKVTVVPDKETYGAVFYNWTSENETHHSVYVSLAGLAMELIMFGDYTMGCKNDIEQAQKAIRDMIEYGYSKDGIQYVLSDERERQLEKRIDETFINYLNETKEMVSKHHDQIESFVNILKSYRYLTELDLKLIEWKWNSILYWKRRGYRYLLFIISFFICYMYSVNK